MAKPSEQSVLGRFDGAIVEHLGSQARFFREGHRYLVETDGRDGGKGVFDIAYTFGVYPLQQYLVAFPDGRIQALPFAWDARSKAAGGQRWFHLNPAERIAHGDPLHWTGLQQNWNYMCAECHSTGVRRNYDAATDRFDTRFSEISVGCEACHGPAKNHIDWATAGRRTDDPRHGFASTIARAGAHAWTPDPVTRSPAVSDVPRIPGNEAEACGRCHARRDLLSENWSAGADLTQTHSPSLLKRNLYENDGQIRDEDFEYGSFLQSRMYAKGVVCTNCHDPHGGSLKLTGAAVCGQCHVLDRFAAKSHTGHEPGPSSPDCIACHMPMRTYMVVDDRHDHSLRIPRPDLDAKTGSPDACTKCHKDRSSAWAAAAIDDWRGSGERKQRPQWGEAFALARSGTPAARERLASIARDGAMPDIVRGTALAEIAPFFARAVEPVVADGLSDRSPLVRLGALQGLAPLPLAVRWRLAERLLADPEHAVRVAAAAMVADQPEASMSEDQRHRFVRAAAEYETAQRLIADRPEARSLLGTFFLRSGRPGDAEIEFRAGLKLDPNSVALALNLADLYRAEGDEARVDATVRSALAKAPRDAALHHALGLSLIRRRDYASALEELRVATELEPADGRFAYVYAIALQSTGKGEIARSVLVAADGRRPWNAQVIEALLQDSLSRKDKTSALIYGEKLHALRPDDARLSELIGRIRNLK